MIRILHLSCALAIASIKMLPAQITVPGSDKETIAVLGGGPSLNLDITQAKLGLTLLKEFACRQPPGPERERCMSSPTRDHLDLSGRFAAAAQDGKRTLFSGGDLTPGLELGGSLAQYWEAETGGYDAIYLAVLGKVTQTKTAEFQSSVATLADRTTKSLGAAVGLIHAFTESRALGFSLGVQRIGDGAGLRSPEQVCTTTNTGTDAKGKLYSSSKCENRIVGALVDETLVQPRVEALLHFAKADRSPSFGFVTSISGTKRSHASMAYSVAFGPTLHPGLRPREVLAAILFTFSDFTDANERDLAFTDIFAIKLYLAIPLTGF